MPPTLGRSCKAKSNTIVALVRITTGKNQNVAKTAVSMFIIRAMSDQNLIMKQLVEDSGDLTDCFTIADLDAKGLILF